MLKIPRGESIRRFSFVNSSFCVEGGLTMCIVVLPECKILRFAIEALRTEAEPRQDARDLLALALFYGEGQEHSFLGRLVISGGFSSPGWCA